MSFFIFWFVCLTVDGKYKYVEKYLKGYQMYYVISDMYNINLIIDLNMQSSCVV